MRGLSEENGSWKIICTRRRSATRPVRRPARACRRGGRRRRRSAPGRPERVRPSTCPDPDSPTSPTVVPRARAGRASTAVRRRCPGRTARSARERRASTSRHRVLRGHERMPARHAMPGRERIERGHLPRGRAVTRDTGRRRTARRPVEGPGARPDPPAAARGPTSSSVREATSAAVYGCAGAVASVATSSFSTMRPGVHDDDAAAHLRDDATSCEMKIAADLLDSLTSRSSRRICCCTVTSRAVVGSSATSFGSIISPMAMTARWRIPPENSCGYLAHADFRAAICTERRRSMLCRD